MRKFNISIILIIMLFTLTSCFKSNNTSEDASYYLNLKLLNVNDDESFQDAKIPGSIHLNFDDIPKQTKNWNKNDNIIVYCSDYMCTESDRVAKYLQEIGFKNVQVYRGGIHEWYQLSLNDNKLYQFEGKASQPFLKLPLSNNLKKENEENLSIINAIDLSKKLKDARIDSK